MKIKQYDKVKIKDGCSATIVEILDEDKEFIADIDRNGDTDTDEISIEDILEKIKKS